MRGKVPSQRLKPSDGITAWPGSHPVSCEWISGGVDVLLTAPSATQVLHVQINWFINANIVLWGFPFSLSLVRVSSADWLTKARRQIERSH